MKNTGFVRKTKQRSAILEVLRNTDVHPTADWVYQEVRKQMPHVSLGTIYRNLKTLAEMGEIRELCYGSTYTRFDGNPEQHYHFVCDSCGKIEDLDINIAYSLEQQVVAETGAEVLRHRLEFYGICQECAKEKESGK